LETVSFSLTIGSTQYHSLFSSLFSSPSQSLFAKKELSPMTVKNAAAILAHLQQTQIDLGVLRVKTHDAQIAQAILDNLFSFEDLVFLSDLDMQTLLLGIADQSLVICLKKVSKPLGIKILGAMTRGRARAIGEDLKNSEKLRVLEIETVQLAVLKVAYEMHQTRKITLRKTAVDEKYI
jgi:flagellar motor switch protein FliG